MTKEALKLALEYIELVPDDRYNAEHIDREALVTAIKEALEQRSFDYKEHAEGLQRDYDLLLAEYNLLKQDLITVVDIEKIVKFKERNR